MGSAHQLEAVRPTLRIYSTPTRRTQTARRDTIPDDVPPLAAPRVDPVEGPEASAPAVAAAEPEVELELIEPVIETRRERDVTGERPASVAPPPVRGGLYVGSVSFVVQVRTSEGAAFVTERDLAERADLLAAIEPSARGTLVFEGPSEQHLLGNAYYAGMPVLAASLRRVLDRIGSPGGAAIVPLPDRTASLHFEHQTDVIVVALVGRRGAVYHRATFDPESFLLGVSGALDRFASAGTAIAAAS